ncbi:MAG: hypothetical protein DI539_21075 [Flavobacterium psychrophilum]|nr:MAG: hypothetical protein DI539_21075 [Flavobacterium psychrophilum]
MKLITLHFNLKLFFYLVIAFILCTAIGTVSHEFGHAAVTAYHGSDWTVHYDSMSPGKSTLVDSLENAYQKDKEKIKSEAASPEKEAFFKTRERLSKKYKLEDLQMRLGGPLQTMLTGTIGFIFLWFSRKKNKFDEMLTFKEWCFVLIGFFWSRQPAILLQKILYKCTGSNGIGDEERIARHLHLNEWFIITLWGIIGAGILLWITFYAIPIKQRFTFITAGLTGSLLGAAIWFGLLGPALLP